MTLPADTGFKEYTRHALAAALALACATASLPASAAETLTTASGTTVQLAEGAPERYVVVKGDTLWAISAKFLNDPWLWPDLWKVNPQIANPHLIYPGDEVSLTYVEGQPQLTVTRQGETVASTARVVPSGTVRLAPQIRTTPLDEAISFVPIDAIRPFLTQSGIVDPEVAEKGPYIFGTVDGRVMAGAADRVYVRRMPEDGPARYTVVRMSDDPYEDPDTGEDLGYAATYIGEGQVERFGDPGVVYLSSTRLEALKGDRLITQNLGLPTESFAPRIPKAKIDGRIIDVVGGVSQIGQYQVVVINKGTRDGLQPSDLLLVLQAQGKGRDTESGFLGFGQGIKLPDSRAGELMVFRTFERVSYGLLLRAESEIHVGDKIQNP
jgi:hypothetical protein